MRLSERLLLSLLVLIQSLVCCSEEVGKYVCALVDSTGVDDDELTEGWLGKLNAIDRGLR